MLQSEFHCSSPIPTVARLKKAWDLFLAAGGGKLSHSKATRKEIYNLILSHKFKADWAATPAYHLRWNNFYRWDSLWTRLNGAGLDYKLWCFNWQLFQHALPTSYFFSARYKKGDGSCCLCGAQETLQHMFLECSHSVFVNTWAINFWNSHSGGDLHPREDQWLLKTYKTKSPELFVAFASITQYWVWKERNRFLFDQVPPNSIEGKIWILTELKSYIRAAWARVQSSSVKKRQEKIQVFRRHWLLGDVTSFARVHPRWI
eukprot:TRINITY_DN213_c0_g1_i4.p1 TRINITY_DN213_c0_g1~~TRINITY_DN213_c0_g1_i4.p1  ORF type:complete len:260 (+),score=28.70 TRINITY_DN213_c0_g1_i4:199-978(+)